jgi:single-strand DNA-binding protein
MILVGLARLGRDMEISYTNDGQPVGNLSLAFNYGKKGQDGKRPTQWIDAALWGERAEKLGDYMKKGKLIYVVLDDVHVHVYEKKDGSTGTTLRARVGQVEFAGGRDDEQGEKPAAKPVAKATSLEDMSSDVPF